MLKKMLLVIGGLIVLLVALLFSGSFPRPFNIMLLFMDMNSEVGREFDEGLASLKTEMEKPSE